MFKTLSAEILSSPGVNSSEQKSGTKRTKKRDSMPARDEIQTKATSSIFSPPECATGTAIHTIDNTRTLIPSSDEADIYFARAKSVSV